MAVLMVASQYQASSYRGIRFIFTFVSPAGFSNAPVEWLEAFSRGIVDADGIANYGSRQSNSKMPPG